MAACWSVRLGYHRRGVDEITDNRADRVAGKGMFQCQTTNWCHPGLRYLHHHQFLSYSRSRCFWSTVSVFSAFLSFNSRQVVGRLQAWSVRANQAESRSSVATTSNYEGTKFRAINMIVSSNSERRDRREKIAQYVVSDVALTANVKGRRLHKKQEIEDHGSSGFSISTHCTHSSDTPPFCFLCLLKRMKANCPTGICVCVCEEF